MSGLPLTQLATPPTPGLPAAPDGRTIGYLRISLTRGCAMRCLYCRPAVDRNPHAEQRLTPAQLEALARHLVGRHGVKKIRLTGGDPTSRPDLLQIIERLAAIPGLDDLAMTTNGLTLARQAHRYREAGLKRVNVSLDTLDRRRFAHMTGVDGLAQVLAGLDAAHAAGLTDIKLNTVVVRGQNLDDLPSLLKFAADRALTLRLIELMPMGPLAADWQGRYVDERAMRRRLAETVRRYELLDQGRSAARPYRVTLRDGRRLTLGFITPMSCNFCHACDRLRIGADGAIFPCLMDQPRGTVAPAFVGGFDSKLCDTLLARAYRHKADVHPETGPTVMTHIGG